jgi:hypothetical protein
MYNSSASGHTAQHPEPSDVTGGQHVTEVSCIGYSSTGNENNAAVPVVQKYGPQNVVPLFLSRPFKEDNSDDKLKGFAIENYYVLPKTARAMFSIERVAFEVPWRAGGVNIEPNVARSLPIMCRMVKFTFKTQSGTQQELKPSEDLFLDVRTNVETGIDDVAFTRLQIKHAKVNSLKYKVLEDKTFVVNQNNIISPNAHEFNSGTFQTTQITQKNGSATQYPNVNFQLSQRKGGKLFYENPTEAGDGPVTSTSGGIRTLLCFHFWYENGHNLLGGTDQPDAPGTEDIQIKYACRSGFVDTL